MTEFVIIRTTDNMVWAGNGRWISKNEAGLALRYPTRAKAKGVTKFWRFTPNKIVALDKL